MPFLQVSGAISISDIRNLFGGPASPSLANYYRGGAYVPATKTYNVTVREPSSGEAYKADAQPYSLWIENPGYDSTLYFNGNYVYAPTGVTSHTSGIYTYWRGAYRESYIGYNYYGIYITYPVSQTDSINVGVPSSGAISISQFFGAEKP